MKRIRVLLADDHTVMLEGLSALLKDHFTLVGTAVNGHELLAAARRHHPDVIISDISMPLLNGIEAMKLMIKEGVASKFIILSMHEEPTLVVEALNAGADGYMIKRSACAELVEAVNEVVAGRVYISALIEADIQKMLNKSGASSDGSQSLLTPRQREILQLTVEGRTMKEVAELLHISPRTVESHKYSLMQTLGLKTTAELVQYAIKTHHI